MKIHRETILPLPEPFYELLERQLAALNNPNLNIVTLNYRDPDYSYESGGYHPVEINLYRQGDCWYLNYFTDFAYCGGPIYGPIRFARHSITILRRVHCTHISGLLLRDPSGPDGYLLLQSLSSLRLRNEPMPD
ncbi:DUF2787 family protein [Shewanella xiamenensis]|uniref:DUF2787 family protein n=1 Tax=Shewanella xiamenensis TaxID=332186 RepID=UPI002E7B8519|nr:DUF2787 family protein [Shewanella xiamenensis]